MKNDSTPKVSKKDETLARMEARLTDLEDRLETSDAEKTLLEETIVQMQTEFVDAGFVEEPEAVVLSQNGARGIEVVSAGDYLVETLVVDLAHIHRGVPGGE